MLRHFLLIAEHSTLSQAAKHAHLSQPALSASLKRLEEELNTRLFDRGRRGASLTASGHAFLPHAQSALAAVAEGKRAVELVEGLRQGEVRIAAGATATNFLLPKLLSKYRSRYPEIRFFLKEGYAVDVRQEVAAGKLDLGIVSGKGDELWRRDELILVASPKVDLKGCGFVTFLKGSATRSLLAQNFGQVDISMELAGMGAVLGNVRAGMGKALLSRSAVKSDLRSGKLVEISSKKTPIRRQLSLVHRGVERLSPATSALRRILLETK